MRINLKFYLINLIVSNLLGNLYFDHITFTDRIFCLVTLTDRIFYLVTFTDRIFCLVTLTD